MKKTKTLGKRCAAFLLAFAIVVTSQGFGSLDGILSDLVARAAAATAAENYKYDRVTDVLWASGSEWIKNFGVTIVSQPTENTHGVIMLEQWNTVDCAESVVGADSGKLTVKGTVQVGSSASGDGLKTTKGTTKNVELKAGGFYDIHLSEATASSSLFAKAPKALTEVTLEGVTKDTSGHETSHGVTLPESLHSFFQRCKYLQVVNMNNVDVSKVVSLDNMFYNCPNLTTVHMEYLDFTYTTESEDMDDQMTMDYMFSRCPNLDWVDFRNSD